MTTFFNRPSNKVTALAMLQFGHTYEFWVETDPIAEKVDSAHIWELAEFSLEHKVSPLAHLKHIMTEPDHEPTPPTTPSAQPIPLDKPTIVRMAMINHKNAA